MRSEREQLDLLRAVVHNQEVVLKRIQRILKDTEDRYGPGNALIACQVECVIQSILDANHECAAAGLDVMEQELGLPGAQAGEEMRDILTEDDILALEALGTPDEFSARMIAEVDARQKLFNDLLSAARAILAAFGRDIYLLDIPRDAERARAIAKVRKAVARAEGGTTE